MPGQIKLSDYTYDLPDKRIAKFPLENRAGSKLLLCRSGEIQHKKFQDIVSLLPANTTLYFNNTRVIPARLAFSKQTGALIEIFLLQPIMPSPVISVAMEVKGPTTWKCLIGNAKRWKNSPLEREVEIQGQASRITATRVGADEVSLSWEGQNIRFVDVVEAIGKTPLPPYLHREPVENDKATYQTVYSEKDGAVAAPTAGLHFTEEVMAQLAKKGIRTNFLTLHVSAGTFQPIKTENATEHAMHSEQIIVKRDTLEALLQPGQFTVAVGTTSMRTLESTYWYGVRLVHDPTTLFHVPKLYPYEQPGHCPTAQDSLRAVLKRMDTLGVDELVGTTEIFIFPGYTFKLVQGLVTNFHQPGSTLILLVAAFIGNDWKNVYVEALKHDYRFLSYGDSSLLIPGN